MRILGISAYYHDSAVCLLDDGEILFAAQEERFTRRKHDPRFPHGALARALIETGTQLHALDAIVFYDKPFLKFDRLLETYLHFAPRGWQSFRTAMPVWISEKLFLRSLLLKELRKHDARLQGSDIGFSEHHFSHAASAFYPSPFSEATVLTLDGVGEWATASLALGRGEKLDILKEIHFPHSLGLLYSAFTYYCGFKVNSGEYKLMGLAPYGVPRFQKLIEEHLLDIRADGSFRLNMEYFDYCTGLRMTNARFEALFGGPARPAEGALEQRHMDIAASIQAVTERVVLQLVRSAIEDTGVRNVCLAGGVALNCVANGRIQREVDLDGLWIQPAAGDAGGALGAALAAHYAAGAPRPRPSQGDSMRGAYLGTAYTEAEIRVQLDRCGAVYEHIPAEESLLEKTAAALAEGMAVGWHQGRMEFGPRALGGRSIIADPRSPAMQSQLNLKVKFRESFRPFAPSVLREDLPDWFELDTDSPYMLLVAEVNPTKRRRMNAQEETLFGIEKLNVPRSDIPAVTHVDYSARVQTVHEDTNPLYARLLRQFKARTGCPVLVNTSFNVRGEPIVESPLDAFRCFMGTDLDLLVIGPFLLRKEQQTVTREQYEQEYDLD